MSPVWLLLVACRPHWTPEGAVVPFVRALDADGDGRATRAECVPARMDAGSFDVTDTDRDGEISVAELELRIRLNDPDRWTQSLIDPAASAASMGARQERVHDTTALWLLQALREEVLAHDAAADVPTTVEIARAFGAGRGSPEWLAAMDRLEAAWTKAGLVFPSSVRGTPAPSRGP